MIMNTPAYTDMSQTWVWGSDMEVMGPWAVEVFVWWMAEFG